MAKTAPKKSTNKQPAKQPLFEKPLAWILTIGSALGLFASFVLTYDKLQLVENPSFVPNCNLNPVISCGSVMSSHQGDIFGFPNPWLGLIGFGALAAVGVGMLAGATFKRWFWLGLYAGQAVGLVFALWLLGESIYDINALCPYCLLTDIAVITMFWYTTLYMFEAKHFATPAWLRSTVGFSRRHHLDIVVLIFIAILAVILNHFWYYYGQYF